MSWIVGYRVREDQGMMYSPVLSEEEFEVMSIVILQGALEITIGNCRGSLQTCSSNFWKGKLSILRIEVCDITLIAGVPKP